MTLPRPLTVLVIDDDDATRETMAHMLRLCGCDPRLARNAETGLRALAEFQPDVIFLDLHMPMMDGLSLLRRIRSTVERQIPVALITGNYLLDDTIRDEIAQLGADFWHKPLWLEDLPELIHRLVPTAMAPTP